MLAHVSIIYTNALHVYKDIHMAPIKYRIDPDNMMGGPHDVAHSCK